jgi:small subunit ribosomal protein S8
MSNLSDPIADFLARLRNAARAHRGDVSVPYSRMKEEIARILKQEGYISEFEVDTQSKPAQIKVTMKFVNRIPALTGLKRMWAVNCWLSFGKEVWVCRVLGKNRSKFLKK